MRVRNRFDVTYFAVYATCDTGTATADPVTKRLWHWVSGVLATTGVRSTPVILTDANGHVGSRREVVGMAMGRAKAEAGARYVRLESYEVYPCVGPYGAEAENAHGRVLHLVGDVLGGGLSYLAGGGEVLRDGQGGDQGSSRKWSEVEGGGEPGPACGGGGERHGGGVQTCPYTGWHRPSAAQTGPERAGGDGAGFPGMGQVLGAIRARGKLPGGGSGVPRGQRG